MKFLSIVDVWLGTNHSMLKLIRSDGALTFGWGIADPLETRPSPFGSATMPSLFWSQFAVGHSVRSKICRLGLSRPAFQGHPRSLKVSRIDHTLWLPVSDPRYGLTMGLSRTVSEINGDNGGKRKFSYPVYLTTPAGIL